MSFGPLQLGMPGQPACPDEYTPESTILTPRAKRLYLQVSGQTVYLQFGVMPQGRGAGTGSVVWQPEEPYQPVIASLRRDYDAVRVRNYTPGAQAQIMLTPLTT